MQCFRKQEEFRRFLLPILGAIDYIEIFLLGRGDKEVREADLGGCEPGADHDEDGVQTGVQSLPRLRPGAQEGLHQGHSQVGESPSLLCINNFFKYIYRDIRGVPRIKFCLVLYRTYRRFVGKAKFFIGAVFCAII